MRQGPKQSRAGVGARRPAARVAAGLPKTKVRAGQLADKNAPKREDSTREPEKLLADSSEQQKAISEILRVMSSSPGDVKPVLDVVAERAARLCKAPYARVSLVDGDVLRAVAEYSIDGTPQASTVPIPLKRSSIAGRAVVDHRLVHHADVVPLLETEYPDAVNARRLGLRAVLGVPLIRDGGAYGVIFLFRREPRAFSSEQVALVETFARQAAIAIENARLFNETKEALEQQIAISEILRVISTSPGDLKPVLHAVGERALKLCDAADSTIWLVEEDKLRSAARFGSTSSYVEEGQFLPLTRGSVNGRAIIDRAIIHMEDLATASEEDCPIARDAQRRIGLHAILSVPLMREDRAIGVISLWRMEARRFTDRQIALVKTFADQAVIAIENVRLFNATKEALEQQTATSEILRVISQSPKDLQPVFDTIVGSVVRLCGGWSAALYRWDGALIHNAALSNPSDEDRSEFARLFPTAPTPELPVTRVVTRGELVHVADCLSDPTVSEVMRQVARQRGYRAMLLVPMFREGSVVGAIGVSRVEPGLFTDAQIRLVQTFADQAVIAIENVRLFTELETRTLQLTRSVGELKALGEVGQAVSSTLDLETVLSTIVSRATSLAGVDGGSIYEYDAEREEFHVRATDRLPEDLVEVARATPIRKGEGVLGRMAISGEPVEIPDIADAAAYQSRVREHLVRLGYRSLLAVPLLRENHVLGGLAVNRKRAGAFDPQVIELLKTFATQSALAIQNARLFREIEVKSRELEAASRHKSEFLANMSHELRTPLNAIIGFSEVLSERMFGEINEKQAEYIGDILQSGQHLLSLINDILDLSKIEAGRMELEVSDFDLPGTIENTLTLVRERAVRRQITLGRTIDERLGRVRADERKVKQVLLNLLSNALKFTPQGGTIAVRAAVSDGVAEISVTDTGVGIAPEDQEKVFEEFRQVGTASKKVEGTGLGLAISRKFIELHGGKIWVNSRLGSGSTFAFTLPLR